MICISYKILYGVLIILCFIYHFLISKYKVFKSNSIYMVNVRNFMFSNSKFIPKIAKFRYKLISYKFKIIINIVINIIE